MEKKMNMDGTVRAKVLQYKADGKTVNLFGEPDVTPQRIATTPEYLQSYLDTEGYRSEDAELFMKFLVKTPGVGLDFMRNYCDVITTDGTRVLKLRITPDMDFSDVCAKIGYIHAANLAAMEVGKKRGKLYDLSRKSYGELLKHLKTTLGEYVAQTSDLDVEPRFFLDGSKDYHEYCVRAYSEIAQ